MEKFPLDTTRLNALISAKITAKMMDNVLKSVIQTRALLHVNKQRKNTVLTVLLVVSLLMVANAFSVLLAITETLHLIHAKGVLIT